MSANPHSKQDVLGALNAIPAAERAPTFNEPWEAQAFALTLALHRRGVFTWDEWAA
ncbi:nitrile hydratase subunit beta, partial [Lactobacillus curvatus]|nr:nitrile hydratase subunit beta [Latilactobacillus curvatus]